MPNVSQVVFLAGKETLQSALAVVLGRQGMRAGGHQVNASIP